MAFDSILTSDRMKLVLFSVEMKKFWRGSYRSCLVWLFQEGLLFVNFKTSMHQRGTSSARALAALATFRVLSIELACTRFMPFSKVVEIDRSFFKLSASVIHQFYFWLLVARKLIVVIYTKLKNLSVRRSIRS